LFSVNKTGFLQTGQTSTSSSSWETIALTL
jgi:hypothetical protein